LCRGACCAGEVAAVPAVIEGGCGWLWCGWVVAVGVRWVPGPCGASGGAGPFRRPGLPVPGMRGLRCAGRCGDAASGVLLRGCGSLPASGVRPGRGLWSGMPTGGSPDRSGPRGGRRRTGRFSAGTSAVTKVAEALGCAGETKPLRDRVIRALRGCVRQAYGRARQGGVEHITSQDDGALRPRLGARIRRRGCAGR
jgi:hypothetical protein